MAYATVEDMIVRFGEEQMIQLSTPAGTDMVAVVREPVVVALGEVSAIIDTYLRKRYRAPLDVAPKEIKRACCILARYELSTGEQKQPTETMTEQRDATISWLKQISTGAVVLDLEEVASGDESYAAMSGRDPVFGGSCGGGTDSGGFS
jgi:phage gp36-like protein